MSKFLKITIISGILLILVGAGICTAALAMGVSFEKMEALFEERNPFDHQWQVSVMTRGGTRAEAAYEEADPVYAFEDGETYDGNWYAEYTALTDLEIIQNGGSIEFETSDGAEVFSIRGEGGDINSTSYSESGSNHSLTLTVEDGERYWLTIPSEWILDSISVVVDDGESAFDGLRAETADFHILGGDMSVSQGYGGKISLVCEDGNAVWSGSGEPVKELSAVCSSGNMVMNMPGSGEDYNIRLDCHDGEIVCPDGMFRNSEGVLLGNQEAENILTAEARDDGSISLSY